MLSRCRPRTPRASPASSARSSRSKQTVSPSSAPMGASKLPACSPTAARKSTRPNLSRPPSSQRVRGSANSYPSKTSQSPVHRPSIKRKAPMPASQHQKPKSDIEISQSAKKRNIIELAKEKLGISAENLDPYGHYKAKVSMDYVKSLKDKKNGKLILVTAISPTTAGEGKTTTTVGLTDALNHIGKKAMLCLREPSL